MRQKQSKHRYRVREKQVKQAHEKTASLEVQTHMERNSTMTAKTIAAIALAASTMLIAATADAGTSKNNHGHKYNGHNYGHMYDGRGYGYGHGYFDVHFWDNGSHRTCGYYKQKARYTGSSYWWKKYKRCVVRYY